MPKLPLRLSSDLVLQIRHYCQRRNISIESFIRQAVSLDLELDKMAGQDDLWELPVWDDRLDLPAEWDQTPSNW